MRHEVDAPSIEQGIRHAVVQTFGYVNREAARMAMIATDTMREVGSPVAQVYYGIMPVFDPLIAVETFYLFVVYEDGRHGFTIHAAASLRTIDPLPGDER